MRQPVGQGLCRLPEIVSAMPGKTGSTIFCHRDGKLAAVSYPECHREAVTVAAALRERCVLPGHRVAIHGATSYEWLLSDLACLLTGAISVALYPSAPLPRAVGAAKDAGCKVVLTDRADCVRGFREAGFDVVLLGGEDSSSPGTPSVTGFLEEGSPEPGFKPANRKSDPFTIVSTSGTLSEPKLFAVHSAPLLYTMDRFAELYGISGADRLLLYLPLSHLPQRMMLYWGLGAGMDFILSDPAHMASDTAHLSPTLHVAVPRSLEALHGRAMKAARTGQQAAAAALRSVFGPAIKAIFVGSAPGDPAVLTDLIRAGLGVYEVYGTTELGMIALNRPGAFRVGTVGQAIPWGDVRIDPANGEILVKTPTPFCYARLAGQEIDIVDREEGGWERTGDVGALDDGYLTIRGRLRDFLALPNGEKVFVRPLEDALAKTTGAALCVVVQAGPELRALLFFQPAAATGASPGSLEPQSPGSVANCHARLAELNATLHPWERLRAFSLIGRMPSIAEGTLTETTKIRRHKIEETYARHAIWHTVRKQ